MQTQIPVVLHFSICGWPDRCLLYLPSCRLESGVAACSCPKEFLSDCAWSQRTQDRAMPGCDSLPSMQLGHVMGARKITESQNCRLEGTSRDHPEIWVVLCGARGWTWWPLWVPTNLWYSVILWDYFTGKLEAVLIHGFSFFPLFALRIWWEVKAYNHFLFTFIPSCLRHKFGHYVYTSLGQ